MNLSSHGSKTAAVGQKYAARTRAHRDFHARLWLFITAAALDVHIITNTALTGATYDIDGGQHLVAG